MSQFKKNKEYYGNTERTVNQVRKEIDQGLGLLNAIDRPIVTIFGSHLVRPTSKHYQQAKRLGYELGRRGYAVITGGGPGVMAAANIGAKEAAAPSIGLQGELLKNEKVDGRIFSNSLRFHFLFVRRFILSIKSEALIFFPGGFGTMNELFEFLVLMQTRIVDRVPMLCIDRSFWRGLFKWIRQQAARRGMLVMTKDLDIISLIDSEHEIWPAMKIQDSKIIRL